MTNDPIWNSTNALGMGRLWYTCTISSSNGRLQSKLPRKKKSGHHQHKKIMEHTHHGPVIISTEIMEHGQLGDPGVHVPTHCRSVWPLNGYDKNLGITSFLGMTGIFLQPRGSRYHQEDAESLRRTQVLPFATRSVVQTLPHLWYDGQKRWSFSGCHSKQQQAIQCSFSVYTSTGEEPMKSQKSGHLQGAVNIERWHWNTCSLSIYTSTSAEPTKWQSLRYLQGTISTARWLSEHLFLMFSHKHQCGANKVTKSQISVGDSQHC